ncbi:MAG: HIT family protein [Deltaproteobacteria bacterium]|nr:HIT family protein [Deltaproteobacteria bacterium]
MNQNTEKGCAFCDIVAGKAPAYIIDEDERSMCILDIHPYTEGHCLVISKRHVPWWHELTEEENASLFKMANKMANRMMKKFNPDFVFLYARGRRIPHTHLFLIPTYSGDVLDRFFNALENFQESPQTLVRLKEPDAMMETARVLREP